MGTKRTFVEFGLILWLLFSSKPSCPDFHRKADSFIVHISGSGFWRAVLINITSPSSQCIRTGTYVRAWFEQFLCNPCFFLILSIGYPLEAKLNKSPKVPVKSTAIKKRKCYYSCIWVGLIFRKQIDPFTKEVAFITHYPVCPRWLWDRRSAPICNSAGGVEVLPLSVWAAKVWRWAPVSRRLVPSKPCRPSYWYFRHCCGLGSRLIPASASPSANQSDRALPRFLAI